MNMLHLAINDMCNYIALFCSTPLITVESDTENTGELTFLVFRHPPIQVMRFLLLYVCLDGLNNDCLYN